MDYYYIWPECDNNKYDVAPNTDVISMTSLLIEKQKEAHGHNEHPYYQEDRDYVLVVLLKFVRGGQEFLECNIHHHASYYSKRDGID